LQQHLLKHLEELLALPTGIRLKKRYAKFRGFGHFVEGKSVVATDSFAAPVPAATAP